MPRPAPGHRRVRRPRATAGRRPRRSRSEVPATPATPELLEVLTRIRARAQCTRRRVGRVDRLSRAHLAADLAEIERDADALALLLLAALPVPARGRTGRPAAG